MWAEEWRMARWNRFFSYLFLWLNKQRRWWKSLVFSWRSRWTLVLTSQLHPSITAQVVGNTISSIRPHHRSTGWASTEFLDSFSDLNPSELAPKTLPTSFWDPPFLLEATVGCCFSLLIAFTKRGGRKNCPAERRTARKICWRIPELLFYILECKNKFSKTLFPLLAGT